MNCLLLIIWLAASCALLSRKSLILGGFKVDRDALYLLNPLGDKVALNSVLPPGVAGSSFT